MLQELGEGGRRRVLQELDEGGRGRGCCRSWVREGVGAAGELGEGGRGCCRSWMREGGGEDAARVG